MNNRKNFWLFVKYQFNNFSTDQSPVSFQNLYDRLGPKRIPRRTPLDPIHLEDSPKDPLHPLPTTVTKSTSFAKELKSVGISFIIYIFNSISYCSVSGANSFYKEILDNYNY